MKVTYNWLKEFVDFDVSVKELAEKLTLAGPEVVNVTPVGVSKENAAFIHLAKIAEVEKHPGADNLKICKVPVQQEIVTVVTNSAMAEKGAYAVVALPGAKLPNGTAVKEVTLKGEKSQGMLLAREHLKLEEKSADIWLLGKNEKSAKKAYQIYSEPDYVLEIELTSNRSDCLSVVGIAREVAAMLDLELNVPKPGVKENLPDAPNIEILDKNLCPRYSARLMKNIEVKESQDWIKRRLELCGIRAINNIVDATNYVLLEYGHPLHAFDLDRLDEHRISVRAAGKNEAFTTLDGKEHKLDKDMLLIADGRKAVALAGIMGGQNSEIVNGTKDILLESAYFEPLSVRKTSRKLGVRTEASNRFERTADWGITVNALERVTELILFSCNADVSKITDAFNSVFKDKIVNIRADFVSEKLGAVLSLKDIEAIIKRLKFSIASRREETLEVKIPSFRSDVNRPIDIVEEVARVYGYNNIPQTMFKPQIDVESLSAKTDINSRVREILNGAGYSEVYNYTFIGEDELKKFRCHGPDVVMLQNPMSADAAAMRNRLMPWLMKTVEYNVKTAYKDRCRYFELGRTFRRNPDAPKGKSLAESKVAGMVLYGPGLTFYDISGTVYYLLRKAGALQNVVRPLKADFLHPVNAAELFVPGEGAGNIRVGYFGEVHPSIVKSLDLKLPVFIAELDLDALKALFERPVAVRPVGKFPPVSRDISVVVEDAVMGGDVMNAIRGSSAQVADVNFTDIYKGGQVGVGKKSLTYSMVFMDPERTLTDKEVNDRVSEIVKELEKKFGAVLRA